MESVVERDATTFSVEICSTLVRVAVRNSERNPIKVTSYETTKFFCQRTEISNEKSDSHSDKLISSLFENLSQHSTLQCPTYTRKKMGEKFEKRQQLIS